MKKIEYRYSHFTRQAFFIALFISILMHFLIMLEIIIFQIDNYYEATNIPLTLLLYAVLFVILFFCTFSHRLCYGLFDTNTLIFVNRLARRERRLDLSTISLAVFDTFGVKFYETEAAAQDGEPPKFFFPFFRFGIIEALSINDFFKMLKETEHIHIVKKFGVLPGYTKKWRIVAITYGVLAAAIFVNTATPLTVFIVLLQSH